MDDIETQADQEYEKEVVEPIIERNEEHQGVLDEAQADDDTLEKEHEDYNCNICHLSADGVVIDSPMGVVHSSCWEEKITENSNGLESLPGYGVKRINWFN